MLAPTDDEMALLQNIELRRTVLKDQPLLIRNRVFDHNIRLQRFALENTEFINCDFLSSVMLDGVLSNVRFFNCLFFANRWTDGSWTDLQFKDCAWRGPFNMGPSRGEGTLRFDGCEFVGSTLEELGYGGKADYFGSIGGTMGAVIYETCIFQRVFINGGMTLRISKCEFDDVVVDAQDKSEILIEDVVGRKLIDLGAHSGVFSKIHVRKCEFDSTVTLREAKMEVGLFEDVVATLDLAFVMATRIDLRRVAFKGKANPDASLMYGLIAESARIGSMVIEDCTFIEKGGALNLQGKQKDHGPKKGKIYPTSIGSLFISSTPVNNGRFEYLVAKEVIFDKLAVSGANFTHSKIERLLFRDVKMTGKIELTGADIRQKIVERGLDTSDWNS